MLTITNVCNPRQNFAAAALEDLFSGTSLTAKRYIPLSIFDSEHTVLIRASLPGFSKDQIMIEIESTILKLKADKKEEIPEGFKTLMHEASSVTLSRSIELPTEIDIQAVKAKMEDGVLEITLPKLTPARKMVTID